jgi:hypothetical protein
MYSAAAMGTKMMAPPTIAAQVFQCVRQKAGIDVEAPGSA